MLTIKTIRADHVIDFAAQELKKYLCMMMPEGGDATTVLPAVCWNTLPARPQKIVLD